jgi:hypothetical protein
LDECRTPEEARGRKAEEGLIIERAGRIFMPYSGMKGVSIRLTRRLLATILHPEEQV